MTASTQTDDTPAAPLTWSPSIGPDESGKQAISATMKIAPPEGYVKQNLQLWIIPVDGSTPFSSIDAQPVEGKPDTWTASTTLPPLAGNIVKKFYVFGVLLVKNNNETRVYEAPVTIVTQEK